MAAADGNPGLQPGEGQVRKAGNPGQQSGEGRKARPEGKLAGTPLKEEDFKDKNVLKEEWNDPGLSYTWSTGVAIGTYLEGLKRGKLLGVRCRSCGRTMVPPRMFCEECFKTVDEFVQVRDTGTVNTFAICYIRTDASRQKRPQLPAVIELDGATKGMGILHLLGEVRPADVKIGMKVRAVWKPSRKRRGDITDIRYFKPVETAPATPGAVKGKPKPKTVAGRPKPTAGKRGSKPRPKGA